MNPTGPVLIVSHEMVGRQMTGPGIRYFNLARVLAAEFPVCLAVPTASTLEPPHPFQVLKYNTGQDAALVAQARQARAVLVPSVWIASAPELMQAGVPLIIDGYDPQLAELLALKPDDWRYYRSLLTQAYLAGDFFICASERQRDWWLGLLEMAGRINAHTYQDDPSFRRLVDLVPFGLAETELVHTRAVVKGVWPGISPQDRVLVWGGGLWPWLDPLTAIRALALVWQQRQDVRLIFPGTQHPNPDMALFPTHVAAARALAEDLGLWEQGVFFGDWLPYEDWGNLLVECDIALTLHQPNTLEAHLAFRSRVLDYIWAGLPIVATAGDATSELITQYQMGALVSGEGDAASAVAQAILALLAQDRSVFQARARLAQQTLTWDYAARPLKTFCRSPRLAPDRIALGHQVGNSYYLDQMTEHQQHTQSLLAQVKTLETQLHAQAAELTLARQRLQVFENGRLHRLLTALRQWVSPANSIIHS